MSTPCSICMHPAFTADLTNQWFAQDHRPESLRPGFATERLQLIARHRCSSPPEPGRQRSSRRRTLPLRSRTLCEARPAVRRRGNLQNRCKDRNRKNPRASPRASRHRQVVQTLNGRETRHQRGYRSRQRGGYPATAPARGARNGVRSQSASQCACARRSIREGAAIDRDRCRRVRRGRFDRRDTRAPHDDRDVLEHLSSPSNPRAARMRICRGCVCRRRLRQHISATST